MIRKHSIKLYWCTLKSVVNITDACTVCVLGVLSRGLGNFGHALEDADSPAQQEVPESPGHGHAIYHQPPHGNKQEHIHSKIYPLQSLECLSGFGQFSEFLSQDKTLDAQAVGLHVGRPVYTLHIKVESLSVLRGHF
mmetsp:Transcript_25720/g.41499  ORF Transcript_25720/g.41499 Transcript_25720/m.41499 type:complete len:137 (+) Transcript_25720:171-581(+)